MLLGYAIDEQDLKRNMFDNLILDDCARYSNIYDLNILNPEFKIRSHKYAIACTYDGFVIVSEKFKKFCEFEKYSGLDFISLPNEATTYWFKVHNILEYDSERRGTEFLNYNSICNGYEEIIGANPVCLKRKAPLEDGFFRTDICFGSYAGKSPIYLIGQLTKLKLEAAGFKDLSFEEIHDNYTW